MTRWFRRLRWPLRDPVIREARDDYRDAQAAIRDGLELEVARLTKENGELRTALATALIAEYMHRGTAAKRRGVDTDVTAVQPRPRRHT